MQIRMALSGPIHTLSQCAHMYGPPWPYSHTLSSLRVGTHSELIAPSFIQISNTFSVNLYLRDTRTSATPHFYRVSARLRRPALPCRVAPQCRVDRTITCRNILALREFLSFSL